MIQSEKNFCEKLGMKIKKVHVGYPNIGELWTIEKEKQSMRYWQYESDLYRVSIHDMFIFEETVMSFKWSDFPHLYNGINSSYIISAHGEMLTPYRPFCDHTMMIWSKKVNEMKYALHAGFPYLSVDFEFKKEFLDEYFVELCEIDREKITEVFNYCSVKVPAGIKEIADSILKLHKNPKVEKIFLESKAKEWASIVLDTYYQEIQKEPLSERDLEGVENVANYIDDHYTKDIKQEFLAQIAFMSKTKLRGLFKEVYGMTMTEYIQRRRISMAELLLLTTDLRIKDISCSVGYTSSSRFTELYYKYMGMYPSDVKRRRE